MKKINRLFVVLAALVFIAFIPSKAYAATVNVSLPMTIRPANNFERTGLEAILLPVILEQDGSEINHDFEEEEQDVHTGRAWAAEVAADIPECATDITANIAGEHTLTHIANSEPLINNPTDEAEAGIYLFDSEYNPIGAIGSVDLAVDASLVAEFTNFTDDIGLLNAGVIVLGYAETRDDASQDGVQASFTYTGIPTLEISYNDENCPQDEPESESEDDNAAATLANTGTPESQIIMASLALAILAMLVYSRYKSSYKKFWTSSI